MEKKTCVLAINMPDLEKWLQGINREGGLAKVPIWEELEVLDVLQDPKDVVPSLENNSPDILFISNRLEDTDGIKTVLEKCKRHYSHVRVIVLLWTKTPELAASAQEILHFCLHFDITTDIVYGKISINTIKNALDNPISRKEAESYKDPNYTFVAEREKEPEPESPKKSSIFEKIKPRLIPTEKKEEPKVSDVVPPEEEYAEDSGAAPSSLPKVKLGATGAESIPEGPAKSSGLHGRMLGADPRPDVRNDFELGDAPEDTPKSAESTKESILDGLAKRTKNVVRLGGGDRRPKTSISVPPARDVPTVPQFINAKIVAFYSPNSLGKTTVLCNMATQAVQYGLRTVAVDLNVLRHDLGAYFGIPRKTLGLERLIHDGIDEMGLRAIVTQRYDVDVIPIGLERSRNDISIEPAQVNSLLGIVSRRMDYNLILVDTCNIIDEAATATVLSQADVVYLIVDQNRCFLEDAYNELLFAEEVLHLPRNKFRLVVNNFVEKCDISLGRIENYLRLKVVATIPSDRAGHLQAVNLGKPYCLIDPDATDAWSKLVFNAVGRVLEHKSGVFEKIGRMFK